MTSSLHNLAGMIRTNNAASQYLLQISATAAQTAGAASTPAN